MVHYCVAYRCNETFKKGSGISFHRPEQSVASSEVPVSSMAVTMQKLLEKCLSPAAAQLLMRTKDGDTRAEYPPELRCFALTLNFYSSRTYSYLSEMFPLGLPHPSTLRKWYQSVDGKPGFSSEAANALISKGKEMAINGKPLVCALMMDEMCLRKHIEFDGKHFVGYVNCGTEIEDQDLPEAKEALMFMVVSLNGHWKIPDGPLPKLPVPPLEQTLERYLQAVRPIVSDAQYERTRAIVKAFGSTGGVGPRLQEKLLQRQEEKDNWAYDWWLEDMYLNNPAPLPVNSNPGMLFPPRRFSSREDKARFAARFVVGVVGHKCTVDRMALPVERATSREKGQPLCMAQYYRLLCAHRQPGRSHDQLVVREQRQHQDEHIVVMCANQMYALPVKSSDRGPVSEADLYAQLLHILGEVPSLPRAPPVGLLTSERRDVWARVKDALSADAQNRLNLDILQGALLVLCLDSPLPTNFNCRALRSETNGHIVGDRDETNMAHQMLHGGGSTANGANRWYDKTVQIVVSSDGVCGLCYEHSPSEGVAVIQLVEDVLKKCESNLPPVQPTNHSALTSPHRMQWVLDQNAFRSMEEAARNLDSIVEDLDFYVYRFMGYGKDFIKKCQVSPDVYIQLALQLAYYRLNRRLVATYESASTRRYLLGRVDCIRSATCEALEWVTTMCQDASGPTSGAESDDDLLQTGKKVSFSLFDQQKKLDLFDMAVKKQTDVMIQNILGQGIDIHLLGLREMAKELGEPVPELFQDEVYRIANHFTLSTSQVPTSLDSFMGYGPVVPDGFGASYNPKKDSIVFCLSAFNSCESTSTWKFAHSLDASLNMMQELLSKRSNNSA